jgi:hypothetical protein
VPVNLVSIFALVASGAVIAAAIAGVAQLFLTQANERRRTQGIVIAHEARGRHYGESGNNFSVKVYVTNEGQGPAFNVRFGVSVYGVRYPFRLEEDDPLSGNRQRVIRAMERRPEKDGWLIGIPGLSVVGGAWKKKEEPEEGMFYWARYEDALRRTFETENPPNRSADLKIRRVRFVRLRQKWNERKHRRGRESGIRWEEQVRKEARAALKAAEPSSGPD